MLKKNTTVAIAEPITVTLPPHLNAAIRYYALAEGKTPEQFVQDSVCEAVRVASETPGFRFTVKRISRSGS